MLYGCVLFTIESATLFTINMEFGRLLMKFEEIVQDLETKQAEVVTLQNNMMAKKKEYEEKIDAFKEPLQNEVNTLEQEIQNKLEIYKAEMKKYFGICEGERSNLLDMFKAVKKAISL